MTTIDKARTERLDIRISADLKRLLQRAADLRHKSVSEFVLDSARGAAEDVLVEEVRIGLDAQQWSDFMTALDAPVQDAPRLRKLLRSQSPFD